jgi:thiamine kinase-like enzyme
MELCGTFPVAMQYTGTASRDERDVLAAFRPALERLREESDLHFNSAHVAFEPLSWMERRGSRLLRVRIRTSTTDLVAFVKVCKVDPRDLKEVDKRRRRILLDVETAQRVHRAMHGVPGVSAVQPIAVFPEQLSVVTVEFPGRTLARVLNERAAWFPQRKTRDELCSTLARIGPWLRALHAIAPAGRRFSLDGMREYMEVRLARLVKAQVLTPRDRLGVLAFFEEQRAAVGEEDLREVTIHGDLSLSNVLVSGTTIAVLDFEMSRPGSVLHDLSRLYTQIELRRLDLRFTSPVIDSLLRAVLSGFDRPLRPDEPLFQLLRLQHLLNRLKTLATRPVSRPIDRTYRWWVMRRLRGWLRPCGVK